MLVRYPGNLETRCVEHFQAIMHLRGVTTRLRFVERRKFVHLGDWKIT